MLQSKRIKRIILTGILAISASLFSSCVYKNDTNDKEMDVVIEIQCEEHVKTTSTNPQIVKKGENAEFVLQFDTDFKYFSSTFGEFNELTSTLSINSSAGNLTSVVKSINTSGFTLKVLNDNSYGTIKISPLKDYYLPHETVELEAVSTNRDFLCYTYDMQYRNGQFGISAVPFSFDKRVTISMEKDTLIYANYFWDTGKVIDYDLNGGSTIGGNSRIHTDFINYWTHNEYAFANTINLSSYASRDGYLLDSVNTKIDGSGERIGIGSRISNDLFVNNKITLYAQWIKCDDSAHFVTNSLDENTLEIVSSQDVNKHDIVIPSSIDGKKVIGIQTNAFYNLPAVENLYLPETIQYVKDGAFTGMGSLRNLHFYSSISEISKDSFDAPNLTKLYLNKNTYPLNSTTTFDNMSLFREAILNLDQSKSNVIAIGHSTMRQNHDLTPLVDEYGDNYNFFIYGATAGIDGYLLIISMMDILRSNDYIILPMWPLLEENKIGPRNFSFIQFDFDCLLNGDYAMMKDFIWESFVQYRELCTDEIGINAYQIESHNYRGFNSTGGNVDGKDTDDPNNGKGQDYNYYLKDRDINKVKYLHTVFGNLNIPQNHVLITWNTYNENCITDLSGYEQYETNIRSEFNECSFFDSQLDNIYPGNYFLVNDFSHLSVFGASKRIEKWVNQLEPYFGV